MDDPKKIVVVVGTQVHRAHNIMLQSQRAQFDFAEMEKKLLGMGAEIVGDEYVLTQFNAEAKQLFDEYKQRFEMLRAAGVAIGTSWAEIADEPRGNRRARRRARAKNR